VFADWLDENGQPERAEYIRLTCAIAREPEAERRMTWQARADGLYKTCRELWFGTLPELLSDQFSTSFKIDRGFITEVKMSAAVLNANAPLLDQYAPVLRLATVSTVGEMAGDVLSHESIHRLKSLTLRGVTPASLNHLTAHRELTELDRLYLSVRGCTTTAEAARFLRWSVVATPPYLSLGVEFQAVDSRSSVTIATSDEQSARVIQRIQLSNLRCLILHRADSRTGEALAGWPGLKKLEELLFVHSRPRVDAVLRSTGLPKLQHLIFWDSPLDDEAIITIANCPNLSQLKTLGLSLSRVTDRGVYSLLGSEYLPNDLRLILSNNPFSSHAAARLRERFPNVRF
jgi:hypothetical protein